MAVRLPVSVSAAVFIEDDQEQLLLLEQANDENAGKWGPPAGGIIAFENPKETAIRETKEEIGTAVELVDLIGVYTAKRGPDRSGIAFVFRGRISSVDFHLASGEIKSARFFSKEELGDLIKSDKLYKSEYNVPVIQDWMAGKTFPLDVIR